MKKFCLILGLAAILTSLTPAFAAPPPPPHGGGGHISAGAHYHHGHRPAPPPRYHNHRPHAGFTIYTGWNRPTYYNYRSDCWNSYCYRPCNYFPPTDTGFYVRF